jgi:ankyrin repeat protein
VQLLIESDAELVDSKDRRGMTPLHWAAIGGHLETVQLLIESGAKPADSKNVDGWTPLHYATGVGNLDLMDILIKHGVGIDAMNEIGWTPLHVAANNGQHEASELLLRSQADPNYRFASGYHRHFSRRGQQIEESLFHKGKTILATPMHLAAYAGCSSIIQTFLDNGGDTTMIDGYGRSVAD